MYLDQEGRGIGLKNKIKTMEHERKTGADTMEAFKHFNYEPDYRNYSSAAKALIEIGCNSVKIITNDPIKIDTLKKNNIKVNERVKLRYKTNSIIDAYLKIKKEKFKQLI